MNRTFLFLSLFLIILNCSRENNTDGVYDINNKFSIAELHEDYQLLRTALEEAHAGLYRYTTKEEFDLFFDSLRTQIDTEMTEIEFFRFLVPLIAKINCVHTGIVLSSNYEIAVKALRKYFPFKLTFISGKAYIVKSYDKGNKVTPGSELIAINKLRINKLLTILFRRMSSDGQNNTYKYRFLDRYFPELYFNLIAQPDSFKISFIPYGQEKSQIHTLTAISLKEIIKRRPSFQELYKECLKFRIIEDSKIAVLTVQTFIPRIVEQLNINYTNFIDSTFSEIKKQNIDNLIIDIRWNDGGKEHFIYYLLSKFLPEPFQYYSRVDAPRTRFSFLKHTDKGFLFKYFYPLTYRKDKSTGRYLLRGSWNKHIQPTKAHFNGNVYILMNGYSFSGAAEFAALAHSNDKNNKIKLIGEETGGAYYGNNSGDWISLALPNSKITVRIPLRSYLLAVSDYPYPDRGVVPDIEVNPKIENVINGKDTELDFTINFIEQSKSL